ncbi:unnamed protein product [Rhizopus microsporus]|nr:hypothetical protein BCV71DRAFT_66685 [Rhizopus microsporus]
MSVSSPGLPNIVEPVARTSRPHEVHVNDSPRNIRRRLTREPSPQLSRRDPPAVQLNKVREMHGREVSESEILRDLVFVFQGIDGQYIKLDTATNEYYINKQTLPLSPPKEELIYRLTVTGWLFIHVKTFVDTHMHNNTTSLVVQSLCAAIQSQLTDYYRLIAILEAQVEKQLLDKHTNLTEQSLTLKRLLVWMEESNNKLRLMSTLLDACEGQKGGAMLTILHNYTKHGDPFARTFVMQILQSVSKPFYDMLQRWVFEGELNDPYEEFFVACDMNVPEEDLWQRKYSIREPMLPSFFSKDLAQKIFAIGKSLNFMRCSCHGIDAQYDVPANAADVFKYGEMQTMERTIDAIYMDTSKTLLNLLKTKYKLMDHLRALKRYMLLGQGDFIQYLMDGLGATLNKPATTLLRHNLTSVLETAIRSSNAQYDDPAILNRLDVRLLKIQNDDIGWDVFTLDYRMETPINTVINANSMLQYLQVFNFLWRLKRVEYTLSASWRQWGKVSREFSELPDLSQDLHQAQMTIQRMIHFIYQLQHYVIFEVLECSWKKLEDNIQNHSIDLDSIIESHASYLSEITQKGFLSGPKKKELADRLNDLFDCILRYKVVLDHLHGYASNEAVKRHSKYALEGDSDKRLNRIRRNHQDVENAFTAQVLQFLDILKSYHDEDLRSLSTRLDYNDFYSSNQ